jgi:hypothetical protein
MQAAGRPTGKLIAVMWVGVNLPWVRYGTDIGASAWYPDGGVSRQPDALEVLDRAFASLARDGIGVVRVFLLCDLRSGVRFDAAGMPIGLDDAALPDIAVLLDTARRYGIRLIAALLDFHLCGPRRIVNGVQLGGRSHLIADPDAANALIEGVLRPIVQRFGTDAAIAAWDVINEPEWCLRGGLFPRRRSVAFDALQRFLGDAVQCIRREARQPITVGSAGTWRLDLVRGLDLDLYQIHWYDRLGWDALARPVAELALGGRPVLLGEFSGRSIRSADVLAAAKQAGYEGALVWSILSEDEHSAYPACVAEWARTNS